MAGFQNYDCCSALHLFTFMSNCRGAAVVLSPTHAAGPSQLKPASHPAIQGILKLAAETAEGQRTITGCTTQGVTGLSLFGQLQHPAASNLPFCFLQKSAWPTQSQAQFSYRGRLMKTTFLFVCGISLKSRAPYTIMSTILSCKIMRLPSGSLCRKA